MQGLMNLWVLNFMSIVLTDWPKQIQKHLGTIGILLEKDGFKRYIAI